MVNVLWCDNVCLLWWAKGISSVSFYGQNTENSHFFYLQMRQIISRFPVLVISNPRHPRKTNWNSISRVNVRFTELCSCYLPDWSFLDERNEREEQWIFSPIQRPFWILTFWKKLWDAHGTNWTTRYWFELDFGLKRLHALLWFSIFFPHIYMSFVSD